MRLCNYEYYLVPCPHCRKEIYIREDRMGSIINCLHCKKNFKWISEIEIDPLDEVLNDNFHL